MHIPIETVPRINWINPFAIVEQPEKPNAYRFKNSINQWNVALGKPMSPQIIVISKAIENKKTNKKD